MQNLKDELSIYNNAAEVFEKEAKKKDSLIAELKAENISLKYQLQQTKDKMMEEVKESNRLAI